MYVSDDLERFQDWSGSVWELGFIHRSHSRSAQAIKLSPCSSRKYPVKIAFPWSNQSNQSEPRMLWHCCWRNIVQVVVYVKNKLLLLEAQFSGTFCMWRRGRQCVEVTCGVQRHSRASSNTHHPAWVELPWLLTSGRGPTFLPFL